MNAKIKCLKDKKILKEYLLKGLRRLHEMNENTLDMLDAAVIEGGIIELEMLWTEFLGEDVPDKMTVLERDKKFLS